jgi:hemolysin III
VLKRVPYFHMVWHLWVLAGSVCHFLAVLLYVTPNVKPLF